jgi:hypothetical protein
LSRWSARFALVAVVAVLGAALGHRTGTLSVGATLAITAAGFAFSFAAVLTAIAGIRGVWRDGRTGFRSAVMGLVVGALVLAFPAALIWRVSTLPALSDISTDLLDPPRFEDASRGAPAPAQAVDQAAAYPDVVTRRYAAPAAEVFATVLGLVTERDWSVLRTVPPSAMQGAGDDRLQPDQPGGMVAPPLALPPPSQRVEALDGIIEAVAQTGFVGFEEDVVLRIRPEAGGTLLDMRSASRVFDHDFGSNAGRIADFLRDLDAALRD